MEEHENGLDMGRYSSLECFRLDIGAEDGGGRSSPLFCSWVYLSDSIRFPCTLLRQVNSDAEDSIPVVALNEKKRLMLLPPCFSQKEALGSDDATLREKYCACADSEFPLGKWVHVACLFSRDFLRLHIDGKMVDEKPLTASEYRESDMSSSGKITFVSTKAMNDGTEGYLYNPKVFPSTSSIEKHHKDSPVRLAIDKSSASDIEEGSDGVWSIVGGKASCRRNFALDVVLLDAFGQTVNKEVEVNASLLYADNGAPVEKTSDEEAPLLTSYDGVEFDSYDKPSILMDGRASFKLKISQLSSKSDNRLFRIRFSIPETVNYPFLEAFSNPVRCVSRNRSTRTSSVIIWKRPPPGIYQVHGSLSSKYESSDIEQNTVREAKPSPSSKRVRLGKTDYPFEQLNGECNSRIQSAYKGQNGFGTCPDVALKNSDAAEKFFLDSNSISKSMPSARKAVSDSITFKYCLGGWHERALLLKEMAMSASEEELLELANQVSLYTGCTHHRNQIMMAKKLVEEGTKLWSSISRNNNRARWESAVYEIEEHFMKIVCCNSRTLTQQDFERLRRIAGCKDYLVQENFQKMWCWLYPVAHMLSKDLVKAVWNSMAPKWMEGFITKEEAVISLQMNHQEAGTFVLRFPTSRSWPHPDAGSIVVTYVGSDYSVHHQLISFDYVYRGKRPLQEMLLMEPQLSQLGRTYRSQ